MTFHRDQRVEQVDNAAKERSSLQDFFVSIGVRVLTFGGLFVGGSAYFLNHLENRNLVKGTTFGRVADLVKARQGWRATRSYLLAKGGRPISSHTIRWRLCQSVAMRSLILGLGFDVLNKAHRN